MNKELTERLAPLDGVLEPNLDVDNYLDLNGLKEPVDISWFRSWSNCL